MAAVAMFADLGVIAWSERKLPDALEELSIRLDLAGAGPLLDTLMATCWGTDRNDCPHCAIRAGGKGTPDPHPQPTQPPPPPPPPPGKP